jgi:hypothetical protein
MKPPVAVTLIIMGTLLILTPIGAELLFQHNVVMLLAHLPNANPARTLTSPIAGWSWAACWLAGGLMVVVGVFGALVDFRGHYYMDTGKDEDEDDDLDEDEDLPVK